MDQWDTRKLRQTLGNKMQLLYVWTNLRQQDTDVGALNTIFLTSFNCCKMMDLMSWIFGCFGFLFHDSIPEWLCSDYFVTSPISKVQFKCHLFSQWLPLNSHFIIPFKCEWDITFYFNIIIIIWDTNRLCYHQKIDKLLFSRSQS